MFSNASHVDAKHSTFSEVHGDQHYNASATVQGNQTIRTSVHGDQIHHWDSRTDLIEKIRKASAPSATYDSKDRFPAPRCIKGTRGELLARITSWADCADRRPICWLNGGPGCGKSAVSQTIAETYAAQKRLAASFFFSRRDKRRTIDHVIPTLTTQLLVFLPSIRPAVIAALENDPTVLHKVFREQMESLLLGPISKATEIPEAPFLIVVDALDECGEENLVLELVALLSLIPQRISIPLRLLITSRPEGWLRSRFQKLDISPLTLSLDIHAFSPEKDIRVFLRSNFLDICDRDFSVMKDVPSPWPSSDKFDRIADKANGLFIFAVTVINFVGDELGNPIERLEAILRDRDSQGSPYDKLDDIYRETISIFPKSDVARLVLGIVHCMAIPLSTFGFHKLFQPLLQPDVDARKIVPAFGSVILSSEDGKQPIRFFHASFSDFLISPHRSRDYMIKPADYHTLIAQQCFETMANLLKRDICGIGGRYGTNEEVLGPIERRKAEFDEALSYACCHWSYHLERLQNDGTASKGLLTAFTRFSQAELLFWIEALSILGELQSAAEMLRQGINWLETIHEVPKDVQALLEDADRLVALYMEPISQCALHVYLTAILLAPTSSIIYKTYKHQSHDTLVASPSCELWDVVRIDLKLLGPINSTAFSPNDHLFATACCNGGVQLWNTVTGTNVANLGDCLSTPFLVCFSPCGVFLTAVFGNGTVLVWDITVSREHLKDEQCHSGQSACIEFSKHSTLLASGSRDHVIQVWSVKSAERLYRVDSREDATSLAFSDDEHYLFSGSESGQILVWDMSDGHIFRKMMGHGALVNCLALSSDARLLASGSYDKTVKLWDPRSGKCVQTLSSWHQSRVQTVHFDNDNHLISACDQAILSWSVNLGKTQRPDVVWTEKEFSKNFRKFSSGYQAKDGIDRLAFAPKSPILLFSTARHVFGGSPEVLMDRAPLSDTEGMNPAKITTIAISSNGGWAVTGRQDGSLQVLELTVSPKTWKAAEMEVKSNAHYRSRHVIPSPMGNRFISEGEDNKWILLDEDFAVVKPLGDIDEGMLDHSFQFSQDGRIFCSADQRSRTLRVFSSQTGKQLARFTGRQDLQAFVASPDGAWISFKYKSEALDVYGVADKKRTRMTESDKLDIRVLCFSDDGKALVGGARNGIVCMWDRVSGTRMATFDSPTASVTALACVRTSRGASIAIGRKDSSLTIWSPSRSTSHNVFTSDPDRSRDMWDTARVVMIRFSDDRSMLTIRRWDGAVSIWTVPSDVNDDKAHGTDTSPHPHLRLLSNFDPKDVIADSFCRTTYRFRVADGWLLKGNQRVIWLPPSRRPSPHNKLYAYEDGLVVYTTAANRLCSLRWVSGQ